MPRKENQKLKVLYPLKILQDKTDFEHRISMPEMIKELEKYDVQAERKSIYNDIALLNEFGYDIIGEQTRDGYAYYMAMRQFELPELKLLVDSVQSAKFITERKSNELIKKLETLCSEHEAKQLQRQVFVSGRIKTMNESIFNNVDQIHLAISENKKITFQYWNWNINKEMVLRKDGAQYKVSPWGLSWDDENYYLVAFDDEEKKIKHYRVDKMLRISITNEKREGRDSYRGIDMADYTKKTFGMFGGEERTVTIECENQFAGVMIDRFGKDVSMVKRDENHFAISPKVAVSPQFIGWIIGLGEGVKVSAPDDVVKTIRDTFAKGYKAYK